MIAGSQTDRAQLLLGTEIKGFPVEHVKMQNEKEPVPLSIPTASS